MRLSLGHRDLFTKGRLRRLGPETAAVAAGAGAGPGDVACDAACALPPRDGREAVAGAAFPDRVYRWGPAADSEADSDRV